MGRTQPTEHTDRGTVIAAAEAAGTWLEYRRRTARLPGLQVSVRVDGHEVLRRASGVASGTSGHPLTSDHVFRVASHSKTFTATLVVQLAADGALRLDDALADLVPWVPRGDGRLGDVTLRQLLSHGGGLWRDGADAPHWRLDGDFPADESTVRAMVEVPAAATLAPGERFKYSNVGYTLLGEVVERVSGTSWADALEQRILRPLGLSSTFPDLDAALVAGVPMAAGHSQGRYGQRRRVLPDVPTGRMAAATGVASTATDLTRWIAAHRIGSGELLPDRWKREQQLGVHDVAGMPPGSRYGLGFTVEHVGDRRTIGHGGGFPGFITYTMGDPSSDGDGLAVSVLTNAIDGAAQPLAAGTLKLVDAALASARLADDDALPDATRLDRYCGLFFSPWNALLVARLGCRLVALDPELPDPLLVVSELEEVAEGELRITDAAGFGSPGERVRFRFGTGGRVERMQMAATELLPWDAYVTKYGVELEDHAGADHVDAGR